MAMEQGNVSRANPKARSSKIVLKFDGLPQVSSRPGLLDHLDPLRIHCSIVSSKMRAFLDTGTSVVPGSGKKIGFSSKVL